MARPPHLAATGLALTVLLGLGAAPAHAAPENQNTETVTYPCDEGAMDATWVQQARNRLGWVDGALRVHVGDRIVGETQFLLDGVPIGTVPYSYEDGPVRGPHLPVTFTCTLQETHTSPGEVLDEFWAEEIGHPELTGATVTVVDTATRWRLFADPGTAVAQTRP